MIHCRLTSAQDHTGRLREGNSFVRLFCASQCCVCLCAGSSASLRSQPEDFSQQLTVPTDLFRPISPHSHPDSENIPRLPPPRHTHTLSRTLRRQVTKSSCSKSSPDHIILYLSMFYVNVSQPSVIQGLWTRSFFMLYQTLKQLV